MFREQVRMGLRGQNVEKTLWFPHFHIPVCVCIQQLFLMNLVLQSVADMLGCSSGSPSEH